MGIHDAADSFIIKCLSAADCTLQANWTEAGTNPLDLTGNDGLILMPLAGGGILSIRLDDTTYDI